MFLKQLLNSPAIINKGKVGGFSTHEGFIALYLKSPVFLGVGQQEELNSTALLW